MEKKKNSYDAKKEKLLSIKTQLEAFYEIKQPISFIASDPKIVISQYLAMELMMDLIWEIVKDEKTK